MAKEMKYRNLVALLATCHLAAVVLAFAGIIGAEALGASYKDGAQPVADVAVFALWTLMFPSILLIDKMGLGILILIPLQSMAFALVASALASFARRPREKHASNEPSEATR